MFLESHNLKNKFGGFGQYNYNLIRALSKQSLANLEITLLINNCKEQKECGSIFKYKKYYSIYRYPLFRISKKYDLWHSLNQNSKVEPRHDIPYLMTVHDVHFIEEQAGDSNRILRFQEKLDRCDALIYISEYTKRNVHQNFQVPSVPEYVIYNGNTITDTTVPSGFKPDVIPAAPFLFSIGEFTERKNFASLVKMLHHLPDLELVLAGNTNRPYLKTVKNAIEKHNLSHRVHIVGKIPETSKKYYFKNCTGFVFPSLREGFGIPPIEAMTYGKPVFMSANTSLPEIGGENAFYWDHFDPEYMATVFLNGMEKVEKDPFFSEKVKAHAAQFDWSATAKEYLKVYRKILSS